MTAFHPALAEVAALSFDSSSGSLHISDSTIASRSGIQSIGVRVVTDDGAITIDRTSISGFAEHGVEVLAQSSAIVRLSNSTFSGNGDFRQANKGGGASIVNVTGGADISIFNSTFSYNEAEVGGGFFISPWIGTSVSLDRLTVVGNQADVVNGAFSLSGIPQQVSLTNSLLSGNFDRDGRHDLGITDYSTIDVSHTFVSYSRQMDLTLDGVIAGTGETGPLEPYIGPLSDNGGATPTHRLFPLSPAVNSGDPNFPDVLSTDQRGLARVVGTRIDMGSVEFQATGDFVGDDGILGCQDVDRLLEEIIHGGNDQQFDLTGDGFVDEVDLFYWITDIFGTIPGDANLDGSVDVSDFALWNASKFTDSVSWCRGDFNVDGQTDVGDFNVWNANKFQAAFGGALQDERPPNEYVRFRPNVVGVDTQDSPILISASQFGGNHQEKVVQRDEEYQSLKTELFEVIFSSF